jgi:hypothetical protein
MKNLRYSWVLAMLLIFLVSACNRYITPYEAAHGKAKCGRGVR